MNVRKSVLYFFVFLTVFIFINKSWAEPNIQINVTTILASQKTGSMDKRLRNIIKELQSVFKYSSYELISQNRLRLDKNTIGRVSLPGGRLLKIALKGVSGNRAKLKMEIQKGSQQIFQADIELRNKSSITIGGPNHKGGNLLFNIFVSF